MKRFLNNDKLKIQKGYKMFKAYNLKLKVIKNSKYYIAGEKLYNSMKKDIDSNLQHFYTNGKLDGTKLSNEWFPQLNADIFISHSHKDFDQVLTLAGLLYEKFHLISFIDSCVWGYSNTLLNAINNEYSYDFTKKCYDYNKLNYASSHVHMMLTTALTKMIYSSECIFFFNTPNSIMPKDSIQTKTLSPWIYTELTMITYLEKNSVSKHRLIQDNFSKSMDSLEIQYDVDIVNQLPSLSSAEFNKWINIDFKSKYKALDYLYKYLGSDNDTGIIYG